MGLRLKFNLVLLVVFLLGLGVSGYVSYELLHKNAREEVLRTAGVMMEAALSMRAYTVGQVRPNLRVVEDEFLPQSVPAFGATEIMSQLHKKYPDYAYKEAALNPTNPRNRAVEWETDIVNSFRNNEGLKEFSGTRTTPSGLSMYLARPFQIKDGACLACHTTAEMAPPAMVKLYGGNNGFGWKLNEIIGAQIVSVPMALPVENANRAFYTFMASLAAVFVVLFIILNLMLSLLIVRPIRRMSAAADKISVGEMDIPELSESGRDEVALLAKSFNRMRRSLEKAISLIDEKVTANFENVNAEFALPQGYTLNEYRIESTLGIGGFGLTYLATDNNLNTKVAIKEYLPGELALRGEDQSVKSKSATTLETFNWGRARFLDESRTLASFRHPNIVRVMRFFEANQTAYMVMEFVAGNALNDWIKTRRPLTEQALMAIAVPLLGGLEVIHGAGFLHRDIKPGNIFIREDGSPVLLDFGSARVTTDNTEMTAIVSPGYAPLEQYHTHGHQGPWSDIYALGAVLYWMITGDKPVEATARVRNDPLKPASQAGDRSRYSMGLLNAIDWALAPSEEARPQTVAALRNVLHGQAAAPASSQTTIIVPPQMRAEPVTSQSALATTMVFDGDILRKIATALAAHTGPIASMVVKSAAKKAATIAQLVEKVAAEIPDDKARAAFVKSFAAEDRSTPASSPVRSVQPSSQPTQPGSMPSRFDAATLAKAEAELAKYIGAVARVVVKRAAAKARNEAELYLLLADQIEDKNEKKSFVRKAMSISGRE